MRAKKVISIDFNQFSENDPAFKVLMIDLMIENLEELENAYYQSLNSGDASLLFRAYHKVKTTLVILADGELDVVVEDLRDPMLGPAAIFEYKRIRAEITSSLLAEKSS
jgi:hypothetical protein